MNNLAFQIYGLKKTGIFQSTWDTTLVSALGVEQAAISATGTNWALNTGATNLNVGGYKHTPGLTTNLTTTLSAAITQMYKITYTISSRTAGSVTVNYGGVSTSGITSSASVDILAISTTVFSITPTSDFDGVISISIKQTSSATNQIKLPLPNSGTYNIWVNWGDGTYDNITSYNSIKTLHTYPAPGEYTVKITGDRFSFGFTGTNSVNDRLKIKSISSWGKLKIGGGSFYGCSNVTMSGITDILDLTGITSLISTFYGCSEITTIGRINEWNTSSLISALQLFRGCYKFNSDISNWNVSNVTSMVQMFYDARVFNQPIGNWERSTPGNVSTMSKVVDMGSMFSDAYAFNQPIGNWDLSSLVAMTYVFRRAYAFNQNLSNWNATKVTSFENMFEIATAFNNGFASGVANQLPWNINTTAASVNMLNMFKSATAFNSNLGTETTPWDVSKVTTFSSMFQSASNFRNGDDAAPINNWNINTTTTVSMASMFSFAIKFNQPIGSWNVGNVTNMEGMFGGSGFNQDIGSWNVSKVTNMNVMFQNASAFNRDIGSWNVSNVISFNSFMTGKTNLNFSSTNLDAIYNGWIVNGVKPNITISFGTAKYTSAGATGRAILTNPVGYNWTITDGLLTVSGTSNNGGLIRVTTTASHGFTTGNSVYIYGVNGTTNANGTWTVTVVNSTIIELQGSTYNAAWTSGGNVILG